MAVVKLILDVKDQAWIDSNPNKILLLNEPIYRQDGLVAYGDGVSQLSDLSFVPLFSSDGTVQELTTATEVVPAATDKMVSIIGQSGPVLFKAPLASDDAHSLIFRIKNNGTSGQLIFDLIYRFSLDLPAESSTVPGDTLYLYFVKNVIESTWDCVGIKKHYVSILPPSPPAIFATINNVNGLDYVQNSGPSDSSINFAIFGLGLTGPDNAILTPDSDTEISGDNGITWQPTSISIPYSDTSVNTAYVYKIRLKNGLSIGTHNATVTLSAPTSNDFIITVTGSVSAIPNILDEFPGAIFAISFRKISSVYSGPCIRIRESVNNTEMDIGFVSFGSSFVFDSNRALSFVNGGDGYIVTHYDQSGNGNNLVQATGGFQAKIITAGIINLLGEFPAWHSDGVNTSMSLSNSLASDVPYSVFSVINRGAAASRSIYLSDSGTDNVLTTGVYLNDVTFSSSKGNTLISISSDTTTGQQQRTGIWSATPTGTQYKDGALIASTQSSTPGSIENFGGFFNGLGDLQEFIYWPIDQNVNRTDIENNQKVFFGTP